MLKAEGIMEGAVMVLLVLLVQPLTSEMTKKISPLSLFIQFSLGGANRHHLLRLPRPDREQSTML
jgi:hypothetical protein